MEKLSLAKLAIVVLAAGASTRLGQPKQLVEYEGKPLVVRQCELALELQSDVYCVLGCNANNISPLLTNLPINLIVNEHWQQGIGNSIACAVSHIQQQHQSYAGVMIVLVDQWRLTGQHLQAINEAWRHDMTNIFIAQDDTNNNIGPPVIFPNRQFEELMQLSGDQGAKVVINNNKNSVKHFALWQAFCDLDTPEQLALMQSSCLQQ
ncbi:nucleotidyltransferase family protein [Thalassotalea fusca]